MSSVSDAQRKYDSISRQVTQLRSTVESLKSNIENATTTMDGGGHLGSGWPETTDRIEKWKKELTTAETQCTQKQNEEGKALTALMVAK